MSEKVLISDDYYKSDSLSYVDYDEYDTLLTDIHNKLKNYYELHTITTNYTKDEYPLYTFMIYNSEITLTNKKIIICKIKNDGINHLYFTEIFYNKIKKIKFEKNMFARDKINIHYIDAKYSIKVDDREKGLLILDLLNCLILSKGKTEHKLNIDIQSLKLHNFTSLKNYLPYDIYEKLETYLYNDNKDQSYMLNYIMHTISYGRNLGCYVCNSIDRMSSKKTVYIMNGVDDMTMTLSLLLINKICIFTIIKNKKNNTLIIYENSMTMSNIKMVLFNKTSIIIYPNNNIHYQIFSDNKKELYKMYTYIQTITNKPICHT